MIVAQSVGRALATDASGLQFKSSCGIFTYRPLNGKEQNKEKEPGMAL